MRQVAFLVSLAGSFVSLGAGAAVAPTTPASTQAQAPAAQTAADANKQTCRREDVTGSNLSERHCHTKAEWAEIDRQHAVELRSLHDERGWANNGH